MKWSLVHAPDINLENREKSIYIFVIIGAFANSNNLNLIENVVRYSQSTSTQKQYTLLATQPNRSLSLCQHSASSSKSDTRFCLVARVKISQCKQTSVRTNICSICSCTFAFETHFCCIVTYRYVRVLNLLHLLTAHIT